MLSCVGDHGVGDETRLADLHFERAAGVWLDDDPGACCCCCVCDGNPNIKSDVLRELEIEGAVQFGVEDIGQKAVCAEQGCVDVGSQAECDGDVGTDGAADADGDGWGLDVAVVEGQVGEGGDDGGKHEAGGAAVDDGAVAAGVHGGVALGHGEAVAVGDVGVGLVADDHVGDQHAVEARALDERGVAERGGGVLRGPGAADDQVAGEGGCGQWARGLHADGEDVAVAVLADGGVEECWEACAARATVAHAEDAAGPVEHGFAAGEVTCLEGDDDAVGCGGHGVVETDVELQHGAVEGRVVAVGDAADHDVAGEIAEDKGGVGGPARAVLDGVVGVKIRQALDLCWGDIADAGARDDRGVSGVDEPCGIGHCVSAAAEAAVFPGLAGRAQLVEGAVALNAEGRGHGRVAAAGVEQKSVFGVADGGGHKHQRLAVVDGHDALRLDARVWYVGGCVVLLVKGHIVTAFAADLRLSHDVDFVSVGDIGDGGSVDVAHAAAIEEDACCDFGECKIHRLHQTPAVYHNLVFSLCCCASASHGTDRSGSHGTDRSGGHGADRNVSHGADRSGGHGGSRSGGHGGSHGAGRGFVVQN